MSASYWVSFSLIGAWLLVGVMVLMVQRDRRKKKERLARIENELALWVEKEQRAGASAADIVSRMDEKRRELAGK